MTTPHVTQGAGRPAPDGNHLSEQCRFVNEILALVGEKWSMVVVLSLSGHSRALAAVGRWSKENQAAVRSAREEFDARAVRERIE